MVPVPGAMQSFLADVGYRAEEVRDVRDFARVAEALARDTGVDAGAFIPLLSRATDDGFARSARGDALVLRSGEGYLLAARSGAPVATAGDAMHDLANALTAVAGWARLARAEGSASERGDKALGAIEDATLLALDLAGRATPMQGLASQSVGAAIQQAVQLIEPLATERRVTVRGERVSDVRVPVGRASLVSAIANLLKNAVEASKSGDEVTIGVETRDDERGCHVEIHVRGGRAASTPQIGMSTRGPGRGRGLTNVQATARAAGGDLRMAGGQGVPVVALLSLLGRRPDAGSGRPASPHREPEQRSSGTRPATRAGRMTNPALRGVSTSILVIDDEPAIREMVTTALELAGFHAHGVEGPQDLDPRDRRTFALALVDVRLGARDGLAVARHLVEGGWTRKFALMTGAPMGVPPEDALAVIRKPFEIDELVQLVQRWTARAPRERKTAR